MLKPVISVGSRSGVHCTRAKLHPVDTALVLQEAKGVLPLRGEDYFLESPGRPMARIHHLDAKAFIGSIALIDIEEVAGKKRSFIPACADKLVELRTMIDEGGHDIDLEVDGGVKPGVARTVIEAGADVLVAGSAVFSAGIDYEDAIAALRKDAE